MQSVSSRIWTRVAESISYDDNHYITGTSIIGTDGGREKEFCLVSTTTMIILIVSDRPSFGDLERVEHIFIANITKSTQIRSGST